VSRPDPLRSSPSGPDRPPIRGWVFDLDGTLTIAQHDFAEIKRRLGLPVDRAVLEGIAERPEHERAELLSQVHAWELDLADRAQANPGARELLVHLVERGRPIGVLTRNSRNNAERTLAAAGLFDLFERDRILGRDEARPKPAPDGVLHLARTWAVAAPELVVVGDFRFDLEAARAAGARSVWLDTDRSGIFADLADRVVHRLQELVGWDG
jgi:HAD superfamily hydrolase (TIGR01509 family)